MSEKDVRGIETLAQLVKNLNRKFCNGHDNFYIKRNGDSRTGQLMFDCEELVHFQPIGWLVLDGMSSLNFYIQHFIMDFCYYSNPDYWFPTEEYNIILAHNKGMEDNLYTVWFKGENGFVSGWAYDYELKDDMYRFSLADITALKATQDENTQRIIDLGKVLIKDEH